MAVSRIVTFLILLAFGSALRAQESDTTNGVAAIVNTQVITKWEIEKRVRSRKVDFTNKPLSEKEAYYQKVLVDRVIELLELQATKDSGVSISEEEYLNRRTAEIQALGYQSDAEFQQFLESQKLTEHEFNENVRKDLDAKAWLQTVGGRSSAKSPTARPRFDVTVTAKELRDYYTKHLKDTFQQKDEIRLSVIQVYFRRDVPQDRENARRTVANDLLKLQTKADFAVLAARDSKNPATKDKGGDTGWFPKGSDKIPEEIEKLVFAETAKEGDLLGPIEQGNSFWLVKITGRHFERTVTFEEAQERIRGQLSNDKFVKAIRQVILDLLRNSYIYPLKLKKDIEDFYSQLR